MVAVPFSTLLSSAAFEKESELSPIFVAVSLDKCDDCLILFTGPAALHEARINHFVPPACNLWGCFVWKKLCENTP
jgi:hypothetical protein